MPRWPRPPNLLRLLVGQHIINGASVGLGVIAVALVASAIFGFAAGQPATLGAISASISDLPAPWREKARTLGFGFALALLSTVAIQVALPWPVAALLMIGAISFVAGLVTGLGRWAVAVGMQAVIPMVFILGFPRETFPAAVRIEMLLAGGGVAYIAIALLATVFTDASARRMVASETIREFSIYMRAVASVFDPERDLAAAYGATIRQQSALSDQLQSARTLLLERPGTTGERFRLAASIGILLDALDALVAAQCDVELIRKTPAAATVRARIGDVLRVGSLDLEHLSLELLTTGHPILPPDHHLAIDALTREAARVEADEAMDPKVRAALDAATWRLVHSLSHVRRLEQSLSNDATARAAIGDVELAAFIPKRSYALGALAPHLSRDSPVLRFAVRLALAMMAGALVAQSLGDNRHGNWVVLTIAVVIRAGYGLTRQRRDDRVIGTLIGCVGAAVSVAYLPAGALVAVQGLGVAVTHSFARLNYRIASVGASVTALVSLHLVQPWVSAPILVRLADTLIGAAIAHLFNYFWPRWEYFEAPGLARRLQAQLAAFAAAALGEVSEHDYRLARKNVIEAMAALSDSAGRMAIEPMTARKGLDEMAELLIRAYSLVAQLSAARLAVRIGAPGVDPAIRDWLQAFLAVPSAAAAVVADPAAGPLAAAAVAVFTAARTYERVAKSDVS
jgi:uncharacterized membrane protein YccC